MAFSFKGSPSGIGKIVLFTFIGMGFNALLWFAGPQDPNCDPHVPESCKGKGIIFDFTICPWSGNLFPILFQMWYTVALALFMLLNTPLFRVVANNSPESPVACLLLVQWVCTCAIYAALERASGSRYPVPPLIWLCGFEALFLFVASRVPYHRQCGFPLRALHYLLGVILVLQFGGAPLADTISGIEPLFVLYIFTGFNKFFSLGFVMTRAHVESDGEEDQALMSKVWPLAIMPMVMSAPSTNWAKEGNLTYPYLPRVTDRLTYVAGGVIVMFVLDRVGRWATDCMPQPNTVFWTALVLYLLHPWFMALCVLFGLMDVYSVWLGSLAMGLILVLAVQLVSGLFTKKKAVAREVAYHELACGRA